MWPHLDEPARRVVPARKAVKLGFGGISRFSGACGLWCITLAKRNCRPRRCCGQDSPRGKRATCVDAERSRPGSRLGRHGRAHGAWRPGVAAALDRQNRHHPVSHTKVTQLLQEDGYSLQGNPKAAEGDLGFGPERFSSILLLPFFWGQANVTLLVLQRNTGLWMLFHLEPRHRSLRRRIPMFALPRSLTISSPTQPPARRFRRRLLVLRGIGASSPKRQVLKEQRLLTESSARKPLRLNSPAHGP